MKLQIFGNNGPYPAPGGACSGYLLSSDSGETNLLIDCGTGVLTRLMADQRLDALDAVVLSHLHFDHMSDMLPMQYAIQFHPRKKPLPVYCPLSPEPVRGSRNEPTNVRFICAKLAELRGEDAEEVAARTTANACRVYGVASPA